SSTVLKEGSRSLIGMAQQVGGGPSKIYKSKYLRTQTIRNDIQRNASLLTNHRFQRGSRIIVIEKVFATPNSVQGGPSHMKSNLRLRSVVYVTFQFANVSVARRYLIA